MRVLAFDVAVTGCSVSVFDTEMITVRTKCVETERGQAEILVPLIGEVVRDSGLTLSAIDLIAVTRGPGSFTGVRIGLSTARSLGVALDIPVVGVSTLDVLARAIPQQNRSKTLILIDTKRGDDYGQIGENSEPAIWTPEAVSALEKEGFSVFRDARPDTELLARIAVEHINGNDNGYSHETAPVPLYLREAEVSFPKGKDKDGNL